MKSEKEVIGQRVNCGDQRIKAVENFCEFVLCVVLYVMGETI